MDFSKLPKMSKTPAPPPPQEPPPRLPGDPSPRPVMTPAVNDFPPPRPPEPATPPPPAHEPITAPPPQPRYYAPADYGRDPSSALISIWISGIVGLICLMLGWRFGQWLAAKAAGKELDTGFVWGEGGPNPVGAPIPYLQLAGEPVWTESCFFAMGLCLLLDALLILIASRTATPNRILVGIALAITSLALLLNLVVSVRYLSMTPAILPIQSLVLILVGGFVLFDQVPMMKRARGQ